MPGKCRPSLRKTALERLNYLVYTGQLDVTTYECVKSAFEKLEEYERTELTPDEVLKAKSLVGEGVYKSIIKLFSEAYREQEAAGQWLQERRPEENSYRYRCPVCNEVFSMAREYCPHCCTKMNGVSS